MSETTSRGSEIGDGAGDGTVEGRGAGSVGQSIADWKVAIGWNTDAASISKPLPSGEDLPQLTRYTWRIVEDFFINEGEPTTALRALAVLQRCLAATGQKPSLSLKIAGSIFAILKSGTLLPADWKLGELALDEEGAYLGENESAFENALLRPAFTLFPIRNLREYLTQARHQNNWKAAAFFQRMIVILFPTSGHEGFVLSHLHERAGDLASALAVVREVRNLPSPIDMEHETDPHLIEAWGWLRERIERRIAELKGAQNRPIPAKRGEDVRKWPDHYLEFPMQDLTCCPKYQLRAYASQAQDEGNWEKIVVFRRELIRREPESTEEMRLLSYALYNCGPEWYSEALTLIEKVAARQTVMRHPRREETIRARDALRRRVLALQREKEECVDHRF